MSEIKVRGPEGCGKTLSFGGETYTADKKGFFNVPSEAAEALRLHGFRSETDPDDPVPSAEPVAPAAEEPAAPAPADVAAQP